MDQNKEYKLKVMLAVFKTISGIIMPFIVGVIALALVKEYKEIIQFIDRGDFLIYSTALSTTALFLYHENSNSIVKKADYWISVSLVTILIITAFIYGGSYLLASTGYKGVFNLGLIRLSSLVFFIFSIISLVRSIRIDFKKHYPQIDVKQVSTTDIDILLSGIDKE